MIMIMRRFRRRRRKKMRGKRRKRRYKVLEGTYPTYLLYYWRTMIFDLGALTQ